MWDENLGVGRGGGGQGGLRGIRISTSLSTVDTPIPPISLWLWITGSCSVPVLC